MAILYDGELSFSGGQHTGRLPHLLTSQQYARGINVSNRKGSLEPRDGYRALTLSEAIPGKFQGATLYRPTGETKLLLVASGHVYLVTDAGAVTAITSGEAPLDPEVDEVYLTTAGEQLAIVSDGVNSPLAIQDESAVQTESMRPGRWMTYGLGRVFQVSFDRRFIYASDIYSPVTSSSLAPLYSFTESPIGFAPYGIGRITGLAFLPILDGGTDLGSLVVTGENGLYAFDVQASREVWDQLQIGRTVAGKVNVLSHRSIVDLNGDLYFRRQEGIGSLISARADWSTPINRPVSYELRGWLDDDDFSVNHLVSSSYSGNKLRMTFAGERHNDEVRFRGMVVMDLDADSGLNRGQASFPAVETGLNVLQVLDDWVLSRDEDEQLRVYRIEDGQVGDRSPYFPDQAKPIEWEIETRSFDFQNPLAPKDLAQACFIDFADIRSDLEVEVQFKTDEFPGWLDWTMKKITMSGTKVSNGGAYFRFPLGMPKDVEEINPVTKRVAGRFTHLQLRIKIKGHARIDRLRLAAQSSMSPDDNIDEAYLDEIEPISEVLNCQGSPFTYKVATQI